MRTKIEEFVWDIIETDSQVEHGDWRNSFDVLRFIGKNNLCSFKGWENYLDTYWGWWSWWWTGEGYMDEEEAVKVRDEILKKIPNFYEILAGITEEIFKEEAEDFIDEIVDMEEDNVEIEVIPYEYVIEIDNSFGHFIIDFEAERVKRNNELIITSDEFSKDKIERLISLISK